MGCIVLHAKIIGDKMKCRIKNRIVGEDELFWVGLIINGKEIDRLEKTVHKYKTGGLRR